MTVNDIKNVLAKVSQSMSTSKAQPTNPLIDPSTLQNDASLLLQYISDRSITLTQFFENLPYHLSEDNVCLIVLQLSEEILDIGAISNIFGACEAIFASMQLPHMVFFLNNSTLLFIYNSDINIAELKKEQSMKLLMLLKRGLSNDLHVTSEYSIAVLCKPIESLRQNISDTLSRIDIHRFYEISYNTIELKYLPDTDIKDLIDQVKLHLDRADYPAVQSIITHFSDDAIAQFYPPQNIFAVLTYLLNMYFAYLNLPASNYTEVSKYHVYIKKISTCQSFKELSDLLKTFFDFCHQNIRQKPVHLNHTMKAAVDYINENYMKPLTLEELAANAYLSKTYFSALFKKQLELSFGDYLESIRITNSKQLICQTDYSIVEIAQMVGFSNQSYFSKVFKKNVGMSPLKYKFLMQANKNIGI